MSTDRDVAAQLEQMNSVHIMCRDYGHAWKPWRATILGKRKGYEQALRCDRCKTERWRTLTSYGDVLSSHYVYPDGYLVKGLGRLTGEDRGQLRVASIMDTLSKRG